MRVLVSYWVLFPFFFSLYSSVYPNTRLYSVIQNFPCVPAGTLTVKLVGLFIDFESEFPGGTVWNN